MPPDQISPRARFVALSKAAGPTFVGWLVGKVLDAAFSLASAGVQRVTAGIPWPLLLAAVGLACGLLWASWPWLVPQLTRLKRKDSAVRGEIVLLEQVSVAKHPELYSNPVRDGIQKAISQGAPFDVGLHIENRGKPTRLRNWAFHIDTSGGPEVKPFVEPSAWPPPDAWHKLFPNATTLTTAEATYLDPGKVYVVYCQVRIKSFLGAAYQSYLKLDSLEVSATDSRGRVATFRLRKDQDAFQNSASTP